MASLPNFNALMAEGFNTGREMKRQEGVRNALAGLMTENPGQSPGYGDGIEAERRGSSALADLARYDPQMAFQIQDHRQKQQAQMDERRQKLLGEGKKAVGQAALQIAQLPEAQRPQAWDQAIDYLVGQGWDGLAQYKGKYNPQSLMGVISEAGLANDLRTATQPSYQVIPEGGTLVNTRDPQATQQFAVPPQPLSPDPGSSIPHGNPTSPPVNIAPNRPANMSDGDLIAQAREAIQNGANVNDVFQRLNAWGVQP